jgi:hypothetical protein
MSNRAPGDRPPCRTVAAGAVTSPFPWAGPFFPIGLTGENGTREAAADRVPATSGIRNSLLQPFHRTDFREGGQG